MKPMEFEDETSEKQIAREALWCGVLVILNLILLAFFSQALFHSLVMLYISTALLILLIGLHIKNSQDRHIHIKQRVKNLNRLKWALALAIPGLAMATAWAESANEIPVLCLQREFPASLEIRLSTEQATAETNTFHFQGHDYHVNKNPVITGKMIYSLENVPNGQGHHIRITMTKKGRKALALATENQIGRHLVVFVNGRLEGMAPIREPLHNGQITLGFYDGAPEGKQVANVCNF